MQKIDFICGHFKNMQYYPKNSLLFCIWLLISTSCMTSKTTFDRVEYRFQDASVPPMYHRSYTIDIANKTVKTDVDVYNTPLAHDSHALEDADWQRLQELATKLEPTTTKISKGATGTKTYIIRLHNAGKPIYELIWDSLNEVTKDTEAFVEMVRSLVPNLGTLRDTPYKPE